MVVYACHPSYGKKLSKKQDTISKITRIKRARGMTEEVKYLESTWVVTHLYMEAILGISLYSHP
jgi:hypothetical protein